MTLQNFVKIYSATDHEKTSKTRSENGKVRFDEVTGFSQMQMEWDASHSASVSDPNKVKQLGLKGHLKYDETFYIALIKDYKDMGWFSQADDVYYTYRVDIPIGLKKG